MRSLKRISVAILVVSLSLTNSLIAYPSDQDALESEAKARADNAISITSGDIYERIVSIVPGCEVTDYQDGSLSVDFTDVDWNEDNAAELYLWASMRIAYKSKFNKEYDSISFSYLGKNVMSFLRIYDYKNVARFTSQLFCSSGGKDSTLSTAINLLYAKAFYNFDHSTKSKEGYSELGKEYGISTEDVEYESTDNIWLFSSFDPGVAHSFNTEDETAVINYKRGMHNDRASGRHAWADLISAINNFDALESVYPHHLDFYKILIIAFEDGTNDRLWEFQTEKKYSGKWETTHARYNAEEFHAGVEEEHDNG